jgi:FlaA1/EpsC-like NDP-sugar epimerase
MDTAASTDRPNASPADDRVALLDSLLASDAAVDWEDLGSRFLRGRRVMITGAGGSIGSALAHAVAASKPATLMLLDSSENGLYQVDRSLREGGWARHVSILGSVGDANTVEHAMASHGPEIIFHAAALKHVPLMEHNPFAAIENNVFGTQTLMDCAVAHGVERIVLVSTDKAVDPCSIMGASKRIAELLILSSTSSTRMTVVRLCNVMGSQGSVLPLFLEQIGKGGPLTVTDAEVRRYFVSMDEALGALIDALEVKASTALVLPRIGEAIRIVDLARHLLAVQQSSATLVFTGLRPGDKLIEKLISSQEFLHATVEGLRSGLRVVETPLVGSTRLNAALDTLRDAMRRRDLEHLLKGVRELVPEYQPSTVLTAGLDRRAALERTLEMQA